MIIPLFIPHSGCPHQCVFCNQKNITGQSGPPDAAAIPDAVLGHLRTHNSGDPIQIAFYGGTFTALPLETQKNYLEAIRPFLRSGQIKTVRLSTRPDCIDGTVLSLLREYQVETVELGAQSMDENVLTRSGRGHTAADTVNAVNALREFGFTIGLQLMIGLPGDSPDIFRETIKRTVNLKPDFVRLYPTLVIQGTPLEQLYASGEYMPLSLPEAVSQCHEAYMTFEQTGISVVRMGLQPTEELEKPGTVLAGPFHSAFGQLVKSSLMLDKMRTVLRDRKDLAGKAVLQVNPEDLSSAIGQKRANIDMLKKEFGLREVRIVQNAAVPRKGGPILLSAV